MRKFSDRKHVGDHFSCATICIGGLEYRKTGNSDRICESEGIKSRFSEKIFRFRTLLKSQFHNVRFSKQWRWRSCKTKVWKHFYKKPFIKGTLFKMIKDALINRVFSRSLYKILKLFFVWLEVLVTWSLIWCTWMSSTKWRPKWIIVFSHFRKMWTFPLKWKISIKQNSSNFLRSLV